MVLPDLCVLLSSAHQMKWMYGSALLSGKQTTFVVYDNDRVFRKPAQRHQTERVGDTQTRTTETPPKTCKTVGLAGETLAAVCAAASQPAVRQKRTDPLLGSLLPEPFRDGRVEREAVPQASGRSPEGRRRLWGG